MSWYSYGKVLHAQIYSTLPLLCPVPPPPGDVTAMATSGSSITVTWTSPTLPDNTPHVTGYTVTAAPSNGSTVQNTSSTTSTVLGGLQEDTVYTIEVVAMNVVGNSSPANTSRKTFGS